MQFFLICYSLCCGRVCWNLLFLMLLYFCVFLGVMKMSLCTHNDPYCDTLGFLLKQNLWLYFSAHNRDRSRGHQLRYNSGLTLAAQSEPSARISTHLPDFQPLPSVSPCGFPSSGIVVAWAEQSEAHAHPWRALLSPPGWPEYLEDLWKSCCM